MVNSIDQYVDPAVSRAKFEREIADFRAIESDYRNRGWLLVKAEWPVAEIVLASKKIQPPAIVTAVRFDYTTYDAEPPSVQFIEPFSGRVLKFNELPTRLPRMIPGPEMNIPGGPMGRWNTVQELVQPQPPDEYHFLCVPGVKEYHDHPGHSGDPWETHRTDGEGRMVRLLQVISTYGLDTVSGFNINLVVNSVSFSEPPL